ncbi:MAG: hypothetical protein HETSPECPRED_009035 [Heterodermia speciosa]|uniref:TatD related DNase n=1 Tax=Heterodermia speciosa TaxID=116794 RepID=A0A8H3FX48_9LECA|nr:MAG: hypothetical protein HETSPECPRED_009035 [Heterodermia speciosa]
MQWGGAGLCYATIGVHPCSAQSFETHPEGATALLASLQTLALNSKAAGTVTAYGEIGLDYDRLQLCPKDIQLKYFEAQLEVAKKVQLPLFLHSRAAHADFVRCLRGVLGEDLGGIGKGGLVHSFTGTVEEMRELVAMGLHVGVNGCSMKTEENLEVVKAIPLDRLQLETDGPWCEIRPSHASSQYTSDAPPLPRAVKKEKWQRGLMVKGRNEPVSISHVAHTVAKVKGLSVEEVSEA